MDIVHGYMGTKHITLHVHAYASSYHILYSSFRSCVCVAYTLI